MAKFLVHVGFSTVEETAPGVHTEFIVRRPYYGETVRNFVRSEPGEYLNDEVTVGSSLFSIVSDDYADNNCFAMRYLEWMGALWKITNIEVQRPRLILSIGGVYNGPKVGSA